ncbi:pentapeptide repeat-containing protein [Halorutilales archaeon Cl-col2-1]
MTECSFFDSEDWYQRVQSYIGRAWDLETYLRKVESTNTQERIEEISSIVDEDPSELAVKTIGESVDGVSLSKNPNVDVSVAKAATVWETENEWIPDQCPHEKVNGEDYCYFHLKPERYQEVGVKPEDIDNKFLKAVDASGNQQKMFIGASFRSLCLSEERIESHDNEELDLRLVRIYDELECKGTYFEPPVNAEGAVFCSRVEEDDSETGIASNRYVSLDATINFNQAHFGNTVDFKNARFESNVSFNGAKFEDVGMFNYAEFEEDAEIWATFDDKADFSKATIEGHAQFQGEYRTAAIFNYTTFKEDVVLWNSNFGSKVEMLATTFGGSLDCEYATFNGMVRIIQTHIEDGVTFTGADFSDFVELRKLKVPNDVVSLKGATLSSGVIEIDENPTYYDMTEASIGKVSIKGVSGAPQDLFSYIRISRTDFEGFDFTAHDIYLKPDWKLDRLVEDWPTEDETQECDELQKYESLEETYLRAKSGATEAGHNKAASEFFVHEMKCRRREHTISAKQRLSEVLIESPDSVVEYILAPWIGVGCSLLDIVSHLSPQRKRGSREKKPVWKASYQWLSNATLGIIAGYGERPKRPVIFSVTTIFLFAVLYWMVDAPPTSEGTFGYLLLSTQSFITFILGSSPVDTELLPQLLSSIEGFIGAFLIAVFVFTLTRSIHR